MSGLEFDEIVVVQQDLMCAICRPRWILDMSNTSLNHFLILLTLALRETQADIEELLMPFYKRWDQARRIA